MPLGSRPRFPGLECPLRRPALSLSACPSWGRGAASLPRPRSHLPPCVQCSPVPDALSLQDSQPPLSAVTRPRVLYTMLPFCWLASPALPPSPLLLLQVKVTCRLLWSHSPLYAAISVLGCTDPQSNSPRCPSGCLSSEEYAEVRNRGPQAQGSPFIALPVCPACILRRIFLSRGWTATLSSSVEPAPGYRLPGSKNNWSSWYSANS